MGRISPRSRCSSKRKMHCSEVKRHGFELVRWSIEPKPTRSFGSSTDRFGLAANDPRADLLLSIDGTFGLTNACIEGDHELNYRLLVTTNCPFRWWIILVAATVMSACSGLRDGPPRILTVASFGVTDIVHQPCVRSARSKGQASCEEPTPNDFVRAEQESANELCRQLVDACAPSYPADQRRAASFRLLSIEHWACRSTDAASATCSYIDNGKVTGRSPTRCTVELVKNNSQQPSSPWVFQYQIGPDGQIMFPPRTIQPACVTLTY